MAIDRLIARIPVADFIWSAAFVVVASLVSLFVSWRVKVNSRESSAEDRPAASKQAKLYFDLDALLQVLENENRGGTTQGLD